MKQLSKGRAEKAFSEYIFENESRSIEKIVKTKSLDRNRVLIRVKFEGISEERYFLVLGDDPLTIFQVPEKPDLTTIKKLEDILRIWIERRYRGRFPIHFGAMKLMENSTEIYVMPINHYFRVYESGKVVDIDHVFDGVFS